MPSAFLGFNVNYETTAGVITNVGGGIEVHVREEGAGADSADSPLITDSNGDIAGDTLSDIDVGSVVHFRVENYNGLAFSTSQITT